MGLIVDLQTCPYRVGSSAFVNTILVDPFGNRLQRDDQVSAVQFAGSVGADWRTAGLFQASGSMAAHSATWLASHLNQTALVPLGFAASLFDGSPDEASVGQATGGLHLVAVP